MTSPVLPPDLRNLRVAVARWALANGRPLNRTAITIILGTSRDDARAARRPERRFRTNDLPVFLHQMVPQYCRSTGLTAPPHLAESLWTYLAFLADAETDVDLAPRSSNPVRLFEALSEVGFLDADGREARPRPERRPAPRRVGGRTGAGPGRTPAGRSSVGSVTSLRRARATAEIS